MHSGETIGADAEEIVDVVDALRSVIAWIAVAFVDICNGRHLQRDVRLVIGPTRPAILSAGLVFGEQKRCNRTQRCNGEYPNRSLPTYWRCVSGAADVPVRQLSSVNPGVHAHSYLFTRSVHRPPFRHGLLLHSLMSRKRNKDDHAGDMYNKTSVIDVVIDVIDVIDKF